MKVTDGTQLKHSETGEPKRWRPNEAELADAVGRSTRMAVWKRHRGRPPKGMTFEDLYQEVMLRALGRLKNFRHGGKFSFFQYSFLARCFALADVQRASMLEHNSAAARGA